MNTDQLIARLAAEPVPAAFRPGRAGLGVLAAAALASAAFLAVAGVRGDLAAALARPEVALKTLVPAALCLIALGAALRLARPEGRSRLAGLALPGALAAGLWALAFATLPPPARFAEWTGPAVAECLGFILLLSLAPGAAAFLSLRRGASSAPALSGALVGLASGAGAATGYSFFCVQDNPLFFVTWYGAAMLTCAVVGAWLGARVFRW